MKNKFFTLAIMGLLILLSFILFGCTEQQATGDFHAFGGPRDGNRLRNFDLNFNPDFNGYAGIIRDFNYDFAKQQLGLGIDASVNDVKSALGLPTDANDQEMMIAIRDKFGFIRRDFNGQRNVQ